MGKIRTTSIKSFCEDLVEKLPSKFTTDFDKNKEFLKSLDITATKKTINKIAGFITHMMKMKEKPKKERKEPEEE